MQISGITDRFTSLLKNIYKSDTKGDVSNNTSDKKATFGQALNKVNIQATQKELDKFFDEIERFAQKLKKNPTAENYYDYKKLIKEFVTNAVDKLYKPYRFKSDANGQGQQKLYSLVEKMDKEMEEIVAIVMEEQKDTIKLAKKIDEMKGLLIDLYK